MPLLACRKWPSGTTRSRLRLEDEQRVIRSRYGELPIRRGDKDGTAVSYPMSFCVCAGRCDAVRACVAPWVRAALSVRRVLICLFMAALASLNGLVICR